MFTDLVKTWIRPGLIPLVRSYIRFHPFNRGKSFLWDKILEPYFSFADHEYTVKTSFGSSISGNTRDLIQRYIYYFGVWEPNITRWITENLKNGDVFVDVGANIGYYSLLASSLVGRDGKVVAIEASPFIFDMLVHNVRQNGITNLRAVNIAVSDTEDIVKLYKAGADNLGESSILDDEDRCLEGEIRSAPLTTILESGEAENARIVKIDVEGAEYLVVRGMSSLLKHGRRDLEVVLEISPERLRRFDKTPEDMIGMFGNDGFHAFTVENDYRSAYYLPPIRPKRPRRLRGTIASQADVVFSRRDVEEL